MAARSVCALIVALALTGCASDPRIVYEPVEVRVPVPVRPDPPAALATPYQPDSIPQFIQPDDPRAAAALSEEGARHMRRVLRDLVLRDRAWRAWATQPVSESE